MPKSSNPLVHPRGLSMNVLLTIAVVVVAVLVIGGVLLFGGGGPGGNSKQVPPQVLRQPDSNVLMDAPKNKVTVVEFLDYQCPVCAKYYDQVTSEVERNYKGRIDFVIRNYPLPKMHPLAVPAARAAEAAGLQGKFPEMYNALYRDWQSWAVTADGKAQSDPARANQQFDQYAERIGLDMRKFRADRDSPQVRQRIERDIADANRANVEGTPTIFVNGQEFDPSSTDYGEIANELRERIDEELAK